MEGRKGWENSNSADSRVRVTAESVCLPGQSYCRFRVTAKSVCLPGQSYCRARVTAGPVCLPGKAEGGSKNSDSAKYRSPLLGC